MNIQPILDEMYESLANTEMKHPVLVSFYKKYGADAVNAALTEHWRAVDRFETTDYKAAK